MSPGVPLRAAIVFVAAAAPVVLLADHPVALTADILQQAVADAACISALLLIARGAPRERRYLALGLAAAAFLAALDKFGWYVQNHEWLITPGLPDVRFIACALVLAVVLLRSVFRGMPRPVVARVALDTTVLLIAAITVLELAIRVPLGPSGIGPKAEADNALGMLAIGISLASALALLSRGTPLRLAGPFLTLAGIGLVAASMETWGALQVRGLATTVLYPDFGISIGLMMAAYGTSSWDLGVPARRLSRWAQALVDALPLVSVAACVAILLAVPESAAVPLVKLATALVVTLALLRHMLLIVAERRANTSERAAAARLRQEIRARATILRSLAGWEATDTPERTAQRTCEEALRLDGVESAIILVFVPGGQAEVLGVASAAQPGHLGPGSPSGVAATALSTECSRDLEDRASRGPWAGTILPTDERVLGAASSVGPHPTANAPILWNDRPIGVFSLGVELDGSPSVVEERLTTASEFGVVAGTLLGGPLAERARLDALRSAVSRVIANAAFHPVFQPIVDLRDGRVVGHEALTRFHDGKRPDLWMADAEAAGLGIQLEIACLQAAQLDAVALPAGTFLSLNASPAIAAAVVPLIATLEAERDLVIEITEHAPVASYAGLVIALQTLRGRVRIAVDDAGAGYAGLQHILEIRPDIVKLDIALVRTVCDDPAKRALIGSMVTFAHETGCTLLAEGIETERELATLRSLGVQLGQGYLFGRPAAVGELDASPVRLVWPPSASPEATDRPEPLDRRPTAA